MNKPLAISAIVCLFVFCFQINQLAGQTYCNPICLERQLSVNHSLNEGLTDPTVVLFRDNYYLFASNAGGYWSSADLLSWKFIPATDIPADGKEPAATVIGDWLYFFTAYNGNIYRTKDPDNGKWEMFANSMLLSQIGDFAVFTDTNGKVYCYYGCTNNNGVMFRELDPKNLLNPLGSPIVCPLVNPLKKDLKKAKTSSNRTETNGVSGSWMTKYNGKYYYQCTEAIKGFNKYGDVVYVSDSPFGPFTFAGNNPFSFIPEGYISGAVKGATFADKYGNWWHIGSITAGTGRNLQTGMGLFPAGFDKDGNLFVNTDFADCPMVMPTGKVSNIDRLNPGWSVLSEDVTAQASTAAYPENSAIDQDPNTYWSARTGKRGEWLSVDLGSDCAVNALQLNFVKNKLTPNVSDSARAYQYLIEYSTDGKRWKKMVDKTKNTDYRLTAYDELNNPVEAQYLKITNYNVPEGAFAISELRIFGQGLHRKPKKVNELKVVRDYRDPQAVKLFWKKQPNTSGYNIRYGTDKDKLYHSYQVNKATRLTIHCPDKNKAYWFRIDAYNPNGIAEGKPVLCH